jgi:hypothetical protein
VLTRYLILLLEPLALSSLLAIINLALVLPVFFLAGAFSVFGVASNLLFLEFGASLVIGGCLMSRQPLEDEKRYNDQGEFVRSWRWALRGRLLLVMAVFLLIYAILFGLISSLLLI